MGSWRELLVPAHLPNALASEYGGGRWRGVRDGIEWRGVRTGTARCGGEALDGAIGKKKMTARCACMRKMLLMLRAMVIHQTPFDEDFFKKSSKSA